MIELTLKDGGVLVLDIETIYGFREIHTGGIDSLVIDTSNGLSHVVDYRHETKTSLLKILSDRSRKRCLG